MGAILVIHFQIWPTFHVIPPVVADMSQKGTGLFRNLLMGFRHSLLGFRFILLGPGQINDGHASSLFYPSGQRPDGIEELFLWPKRMGMLLQNNIIISAVKDVELRFGVFNVLGEESGGMGQHGDVAVVALFVKSPFDQQGHVIVIGMAVPNEQNINSFFSIMQALLLALQAT